MGNRSWRSIRSQVAQEVSDVLGLEGDLVINEIRTAETKAEAIKRLKSIKSDAQTALEIVTGY